MTTKVPWRMLTPEKISPQDNGARGDGVSDDTTALQAAINAAAAKGKVLTATPSDVFLISSAITIPDNFQCDFNGAWVKRKTGTVATYDLWVNDDPVNGNTGIDIRNVNFDGQRAADALSAATPSHRFCGLRLIKCSGYLENVRADNTVNGEIQVEGIRGGIMLEGSLDMKARGLYGKGTAGSAVFVYQGNNYIDGVWTATNTGSGFTSFGCDDNEFHHIHSDGSGTSGVSVNGNRIKCSHLYATGAALNFAGVNIGHDSVGNRADDAQISHVFAKNNAGWGIVVGGSSNVVGENWKAESSAGTANMRALNSPGLRVTGYRGHAAVETDVILDGSGRYYLDALITNAAANGITARNSATLVVSEGSVITGCSTAGVQGAIIAELSAEVTFKGKALNNNRFGIIASATNLFLDGAIVRGNTAGNFSTLSGGTIQYRNVRSGTGAMAGTVTATAASTVTTVLNDNAQNVARVRVWPGNALAVTRPPFVNTVSPGVSFTFTLPSAAAGTEIYYWALD